MVVLPIILGILALTMIVILIVFKIRTDPEQKTASNLSWGVGVLVVLIVLPLIIVFWDSIKDFVAFMFGG